MAAAVLPSTRVGNASKRQGTALSLVSERDGNIELPNSNGTNP